MRTGVCPKCGASEAHAARGYFEHYVADPGKLSEVAGSWARIEPS
jgi:hypothetical protein